MLFQETVKLKKIITQSGYVYRDDYTSDNQCPPDAVL